MIPSASLLRSDCLHILAASLVAAIALGRNIFNTSYPVNIAHGVDTVTSFHGMDANYGAAMGVRI